MHLGPDWQWGVFWLESGRDFVVTVVAFALAYWAALRIFNREQTSANADRDAEEERREADRQAERVEMHRQRERDAMAELFPVLIRARSLVIDMEQLDDERLERLRKEQELEEVRAKAAERRRQENPWFAPTAYNPPTFLPSVYTPPLPGTTDRERWDEMSRTFHEIEPDLLVIGLKYFKAEAGTIAATAVPLLVSLYSEFCEEEPDRSETDRWRDDLEELHNRSATRLRDMAPSAKPSATE